MDWYLTLAFTLVGCGVVALTAEFFLPTGGVLVVAGVACFAVAVGLILLYGSTMEAVVSVIAMSVGLPIIGFGMFRAWSLMALKPEPETATTAARVGDPELESLKGRYGKTITPMRPAGSVELDGRRIDAISEGMMIDAGVPIKCIDVKAGRVIVRTIDARPDLADFQLDDLTR